MKHNRLILKNSLFMAVRMIITMCISLYTSRVVLQQLGVTDYGIYNVVGGLALLASFLTTSLMAAMQRYMNVELGRIGTRDMQRIFSACCVCVAAFVIIFIIINETAGVWFLNNRLSIPAGRVHDANIVFQCSILIVGGELVRAPYNSLITVYERMSFYAYNSLIEAALKLTAVILLALSSGDKLIIYVWMMVGITVCVNISYIVYCRYNFGHLRFSLRSDIRQTLEIARFTGWNILTSIAEISYHQGVAMILNIFYGVVYNATMGIASQIRTAVMSFTRSVQYASNPQIVKAYSSGAIEDYRSLFIQTSRLSYYMVFFVGLPILLNTQAVLSIWLAEIPPQAAVFARLMVAFCIIDSLTGPLWISMQAHGRIASYQTLISILWICCLPATYAAFHYGLPPYALLIVLILLNMIILVVRVLYNRRYCGIPIRMYAGKVVTRLAAVSLCGAAVPAILALYVPGTITRLIVTTAAVCVCVPAAVYAFGITSAERALVRSYLRGRTAAL